MQTLRILALLTGAVSLGCTGNIAGNQGPAGNNSGDGTNNPGNGAGNTGATGGGGSKTNPPPNNSGALNDAMTVPGAAPLRRLTKLEYDNTIQDLLGISLSA